jgi:hypothetical protein
MDADWTNKNYDLLGLVAHSTALRKSGAYHSGPCPFCGGRDRFTVKHTPRGYRWFCRHCGDGVYHTAIDYVMRLEALPFKQALAWMGEDSCHSPAAPARQSPTPAPRSGIPTPDEAWQERGRAFIETACQRLAGSPQATPARDYLDQRGLTEGSWLWALLGYAEIYDPKVQRTRPAVCIPHTDGPLHLLAIKYRFIDPDPYGLRYTSQRGSVPLFYGLEGLHDRQETLLLVEGELNQLSIFQTFALEQKRRDPRTAVLSPGSERLNQAQKLLLPVIARRFKHLIVWTDKADMARQIEVVVGRSCTKLRSPFGLDANDLLCRGVLGEFLEGVRERVRGGG